VCSGAKIFGSALLQPARSVCVSSECFFSLQHFWYIVFVQIDDCTRAVILHSNGVLGWLGAFAGQSSTTLRHASCHTVESQGYMSKSPPSEFYSRCSFCHNPPNLPVTGLQYVGCMSWVLCVKKGRKWRALWKNRTCSTTMKLRKSLVKPMTWQKTWNYNELFSSSAGDRQPGRT